MNTTTRITATLTLKRPTPGTYLYENPDKDSPITTIYVKKPGFVGDAPKTITLTLVAE